MPPQYYKQVIEDSCKIMDGVQSNNFVLGVWGWGRNIFGVWFETMQQKCGYNDLLKNDTPGSNNLNTTCGIK